MKLLIKLLGLGLIVAAAISYDRKRLRRLGRLDAGFLGERGAGRDLDDEIVAEAVIVEISDVDPLIVGIAEVDPEPLANVAGEGIDLDAVDEAHRSIREQRERLPFSRKDVP